MQDQVGKNCGSMRVHSSVTALKVRQKKLTHTILG